jgi:hypothetical protein
VTVSPASADLDTARPVGVRNGPGPHP